MKYYSLLVPALICGFCMQNSDFWTSIQVSMSTRHNLSFCACKTAWWAPELPLSLCPSSNLWFLNAKQRILDQNYKSPLVPDLICGFCMQNIDFWTRITSVYGSQTSPVVLCMQNSVISTESLVSIRPSPHLWLCAFKTATLALEWLVYMVSSPHLCFCACKTETLGPDLQVCMGPRPHLSFRACKTSWLAPESLVSMCPIRHLWFLDANSDFWTRITSH